MIRFAKFLFGAFADREGATRTTAAVVAAVSICYGLFVTMPEYKEQVANRDMQLSLLWHQLHLTQDVLAEHGIYVPREENDNQLKK